MDLLRARRGVSRSFACWAGLSLGLAPAASVFADEVDMMGGFDEEEEIEVEFDTSVTEEEFHRRLQELDSPLYTHVGGTAMTEAEPRLRP